MHHGAPGSLCDTRPVTEVNHQVIPEKEVNPNLKKIELVLENLATKMLDVIILKYMLGFKFSIFKSRWLKCLRFSLVGLEF